MKFTTKFLQQSMVALALLYAVPAAPSEQVGGSVLKAIAAAGCSTVALVGTYRSVCDLYNKLKHDRLTRKLKELNNYYFSHTGNSLTEQVKQECAVARAEITKEQK